MQFPLFGWSPTQLTFLRLLSDIENGYTYEYHPRGWDTNYNDPMSACLDVRLLCPKSRFGPGPSGIAVLSKVKMSQKAIQVVIFWRRVGQQVLPS